MEHKSFEEWKKSMSQPYTGLNGMVAVVPSVFVPYTPPVLDVHELEAKVYDGPPCESNHTAPKKKRKRKNKR